MQTQVTFKSDAFPSFNSDIEGPNFEAGVFGKRLADNIAGKLPDFGFEVATSYAEDWGWAVEIRHDGKFPLFVGCSHVEDTKDGFQCFIEPSKPYIRRWFKKIDVRETVTSLSAAIKAILETDPRIHSVEWQ